MSDELRAPSLTVFAIEEPENHLSPHYLSRILGLLRRVAEADAAQVLLTSHSPGILGRIDPGEVRHLRLDPDRRTTVVRRITLPAAADQAYKYVKEAVRAYPELYFARLVVLAEGDSEEVVLPRVAECHDLPVDPSFVSVVPLGGCHVNHFWRLLTDLTIPFVTLLDLDRERYGGGWGRIKYACQQLLAIGMPRQELLCVRLADGSDGVLTDEQLGAMHTWDVEHTRDMDLWVARCEHYDLFFSSPLDIDFLMLRAFPEAYRAAATGMGPRIPKVPSAAYEARAARARLAVLKDEGSDGSTYSAQDLDAFIWYSHLFLGKGKPSTHILALNQLTREQMRVGTPPVLRGLVGRIREKLRLAAEEADAANA